MTYKIIEAPIEAIYLSEFITELPKGILNKSACGVGGTEMAIKSKESYIVAVPTIEIIVNKKNQNPEIIEVYGDTQYQNFVKEIKSKSTYKIFTTYDSLPKTVTWLSNLGINAHTECRLLVDEYHKILNDYSYRDKAIDKLLKQASLFSYTTYLSATPIKPKFTPKILEDLDYTEIKWHTKQIKLHRKKTPNPFVAVVKIITRYKANNYQMTINGQVSNEAYFFVNSVKAIKDILENAQLTQDEVKIICSRTARNQHILGDFEIDNVHDENKPFTFITSKSFLGVDFYSETGIIYVVSNVGRKNTLLDISTDITQIAGRIRNVSNPFKDTIFHIYNTGIQELSQKEFKENIEKKIDDTLVQINVFNNKLEPKEKSAFLVRYELDIENDYSYYNSETNELEFNELKKLNEEFNYEILFTIYNNGISVRQGYLDAGFKLEANQEYEKAEEDFLASATSISYQSMLKQYVEIVDKCELSEQDSETLKEINRLDPSIKKAINALGIKRIRSLRYVKAKINNEIYSQCDQVAEAVKSNLDTKITKGNFYSTNECKMLLKNIYQTLKLSIKPKGVDILKYKEGVETSRKIDSKKVLGYCF